MGDCASGVETAPKLEMESGESSAERLRLEPMTAEMRVIEDWQMLKILGGVEIV